MNWKRWTLLIIALLLVSGALWFWSWSTAEPEPFDTTADLLALEREMIGYPYDAEKWQGFAALTEEIEASLEKARQRIAKRHAVDPYALRLDLGDLANEADNSPELNEASRELVQWYVESDLPLRLTQTLRTPGLRAPSISEQGDLTVHSLLDVPLMTARQLAQLEDARMRSAIASENHDLIAECASNIATLARLQASQPMLLTMNLSESLWLLQHETTQEMITGGHGIRPHVAQSLIPIYEDWLSGSSDRIANFIAGERIGFRSMLDDTYENGIDPSLNTDIPPRIVWESQKQLDANAVAYFDGVREYARKGPRQGEMPDLPFRESNPSGRDAPLVALMPLMAPYVKASIWNRTISGATLLHMAIVVYEDEHNAPPPTLGALVTSGILQSLPVDPYAEDGAYVYRLDAAAPGGYRLYSVGPDGVDDLGAGESWPAKTRFSVSGEDILFPWRGRDE